MIEPTFADSKLADGVSLFPFGLERDRAANAARVTAGRSLPPRIALPDPVLVDRDRQHSAATARAETLASTQVALRIVKAAEKAHADGRREGHRQGYQRGWKCGTSCGIFCGTFGTLLVGACALVLRALWLGRHAWMTWL